ncbi:MAG: hypothetical protein V4568_01210 [Pseudomonadota bacterium]
MRKTKGIIFLIVWFIWAAVKDISCLIRPDVATDYYILSSVGLGALFFVMALAVFILNTVSVFYLFKPRPTGLLILFNALVAAVVQSTVTIVVTLSNLPGAREAYVNGRQQQGLPIRNEAAMNTIFSSSTMTLAWLMMIAFYATVAYFVYRNKAYFQPPTAT